METIYLSANRERETFRGQAKSEKKKEIKNL
jgi:hypothetical protein